MSSSLFSSQQSTANQLKQMMSDINSPQMKAVFNLLNGKGITAEQAVRELCSQRGIDVNSLIDSIKKL